MRIPRYKLSWRLQCFASASRLSLVCLERLETRDVNIVLFRAHEAVSLHLPITCFSNKSDIFSSATEPWLQRLQNACMRRSEGRLSKTLYTQVRGCLFTTPKTSSLSVDHTQLHCSYSTVPIFHTPATSHDSDAKVAAGPWSTANYWQSCRGVPKKHVSVKYLKATLGLRTTKRLSRPSSAFTQPLRKAMLPKSRSGRGSDTTLKLRITWSADRPISTREQQKKVNGV